MQETLLFYTSKYIKYVIVSCRFSFRQSIDHCYVSRPSGPKQLLRGNLVSGGMESAQEVQLLPEGANL